jgi:hypothetical protein
MGKPLSRKDKLRLNRINISENKSVMLLTKVLAQELRSNYLPNARLPDEMAENNIRWGNQ